MNTKLALRMDENLINQATAYAAKQGRSVSDLAETYFAQLRVTNKDENTKTRPVTDVMLKLARPRRSSLHDFTADNKFLKCDYRAYLEQKHR